MYYGILLWGNTADTITYNNTIFVLGGFQVGKRPGTSVFSHPYGPQKMMMDVRDMEVFLISTGLSRRNRVGLCSTICTYV